MGRRDHCRDRNGNFKRVRVSTIRDREKGEFIKLILMGPCGGTGTSREKVNHKWDWGGKTNAVA